MKNAVTVILLALTLAACEREQKQYVITAHAVVPELRQFVTILAQVPIIRVTGQWKFLQSGVIAFVKLADS